MNDYWFGASGGLGEEGWCCRRRRLLLLLLHPIAASVCCRYVVVLVGGSEGVRGLEEWCELGIREFEEGERLGYHSHFEKKWILSEKNKNYFLHPFIAPFH